MQQESNLPMPRPFGPTQPSPMTTSKATQCTVKAIGRWSESTTFCCGLFRTSPAQTQTFAYDFSEFCFVWHNSCHVMHLHLVEPNSLPRPASRSDWQCPLAQRPRTSPYSYPGISSARSPEKVNNAMRNLSEGSTYHMMQSSKMENPTSRTNFGSKLHQSFVARLSPVCVSNRISGCLHVSIRSIWSRQLLSDA